MKNTSNQKNDSDSYVRFLKNIVMLLKTKEENYSTYLGDNVSPFGYLIKVYPKERVAEVVINNSFLSKRTCLEAPGIKIKFSEKYDKFISVLTKNYNGKYLSGKPVSLNTPMLNELYKKLDINLGLREMAKY